jgi:hypothetical protein
VRICCAAPGCEAFLRNAYQWSGSVCPHSSKMDLLEDRISTDCLLDDMILALVVNDIGDM